MIVVIFLLAFFSSLSCYSLVSRRLVNQERTAAVRRLAGKQAAHSPTHKGEKPLLMQMADEVR